MLRAESSINENEPSPARNRRRFGTAILLATVVGSGIMAERLAGGNVAVALLANIVATRAALVALILTFGGISGAHFDSAVTVCDNAKETCLVFSGRATGIHQSFEDSPPAESDYESQLAVFRRVRDELRKWLRQFINEKARSKKA